MNVKKGEWGNRRNGVLGYGGRLVMGLMSDHFDNLGGRYFGLGEIQGDKVGLKNRAALRPKFSWAILLAQR